MSKRRWSAIPTAPHLRNLCIQLPLELHLCLFQVAGISSILTLLDLALQELEVDVPEPQSCTKVLVRQEIDMLCVLVNAALQL